MTDTCPDHPEVELGPWQNAWSTDLGDITHDVKPKLKEWWYRECPKDGYQWAEWKLVRYSRSAHDPSIQTAIKIMRNASYGVTPTLSTVNITKPYPCPECKETFKSGFEVYKHYRQTHGHIDKQKLYNDLAKFEPQKPWSKICCEPCWNAKNEKCICKCKGAHHQEGLPERQAKMEKFA